MLTGALSGGPVGQARREAAPCPFTVIYSVTETLIDRALFTAQAERILCTIVSINRFFLRGRPD